MEPFDVDFFFEDIENQEVKPELLEILIRHIGQSYQLESLALSYVFCSDEYLLQINKEHLNHDFYTDIITFDLSEDPTSKIIEGDIFISLDRVADNAKTESVSFTEELARVASHGLLHLIGFKDKTEEEAKEMRQNEEACLVIWRAFN
jgi:rRNA maturation RNase YbeY